MFEERKYPFQNSPMAIRAIKNRRKMGDLEEIGMRAETDVYNEYIFGDTL